MKEVAIAINKAREQQLAEVPFGHPVVSLDADEVLVDKNNKRCYIRLDALSTAFLRNAD